MRNIKQCSANIAKLKIDGKPEGRDYSNRFNESDMVHVSGQKNFR